MKNLNCTEKWKTKATCYFPDALHNTEWTDVGDSAPVRNHIIYYLSIYCIVRGIQIREFTFNDT